MGSNNSQFSHTVVAKINLIPLQFATNVFYFPFVITRTFRMDYFETVSMLNKNLDDINNLLTTYFLTDGFNQKSNNFEQISLKISTLSVYLSAVVCGKIGAHSSDIWPARCSD